MKKVKLAADCHVDGEERKAGEIVNLPDEIAADFGEVIEPEAVVEPEPVVEAESENDSVKKSKK